MTKKSSDLIDRQLARYRQMRDFQATAEPQGGSRGSAAKAKVIAREKAGSGLPFVVQKHSATRLHYDFRLGLHGVLKSWAVTKGPSYVTADKRLAVEVEDHPMEYGGFEGTIPKGQYGGGTVMLWDEGTWEPVGDPDEGLRKGMLKFILYGKKLHGKWVLVRMGGHAAKESKPNWLLIKEHDEYERTPDDPAITEEAPDSVATKRDLEAIARDQDHVWNSNRPEKAAAQKAALKHRQSPGRASRFTPAKGLPGKREALPDFLPPQLAAQASQPPQGEGWIHELKLDGYRIQAHLERSKRAGIEARLFTRKGLDWTHRMRQIAGELERLQIDAAILDGEIVVLTESGKTSFAALQAAFDESKPSPLTYFVFDLLHLNGHNLRNQPLIERKQWLADLMGTLPPDDSIRLSEHVEGSGKQTFEEACRLGAEGIVSKRSTAPYTGGRSSSWVKAKCIRRQEFVIGGFTEPNGASNQTRNHLRGIGALLLGYYEDHHLKYAGRTGTGFTESSSRKLRERLEALRRVKPAFTRVPAAAARGVIWTEPKLVAEVQFSTWTADHIVRQASFKGIREDKAAEEVRREEADPQLSKELAEENREKKGAEGARGKEQRPADRETKSASATKRASSPTEEKKAPAIRVTHPGKIIDPVTKLTKQALVDYYLAVAQQMLPHVAGRPLSLVRCPEGAAHQCFFQKHWERGMPSGVDAIAVPNKNGKGSENYVTLSTAEALAGLAQMNVLEIHPWGSTNADLDDPDRLIFDLDPDEAVSWRTLADAAREVQERLQKLELKSFLKSTGGKGLHIVTPLRPEHDWSVIKAFAQAIALEMESENGQLYISKMTKAARKNKIFVDYMRNERGATAIAPYSPRARPGLTAALPLRWAELKGAERPRFPIADFAGWRSRLGRDPWKEMDKFDQRLPAEIAKAFRK
jgi:bifunctional non-homologous end joining protein LigD